ncbi:MAG TPA: Mth938-like domain-containing protein [Burkholderiales bacterium]|nr:Mth938-like domain-containing protein [Burkholderiales bacterium]
MKLHASNAGAANIITAYGEDYVMVSGARRDSAVIVTATEVKPWGPNDFDDLKEQDFAELAQLGAEIVLLGTGKRQRFPHPGLTASFGAARVGLEVMDLKAACRTYNILVAEERKVALALVFR